MTAKSNMRGHEIEYIDGIWVYSDTKNPADDSRACKKCGKFPTPEGYDACTGHIEAAWHACCGHGIEKGYTL